MLNSDMLPAGKDAPLNSSIDTMRARLVDLGVDVEERAWLNPVAGAWSVNLTLSGCATLFTNGKGNSEEAALASAYGELFERLTTSHLFSDLYLPWDEQSRGFAYAPGEVWLPAEMDRVKASALSAPLWDFYDHEDELTINHLLDFNTGGHHGVCCLPFTREGEAPTLFPVAVLENLYVSNGMAAGNTFLEAKVQALSEVVERHVKSWIIAQRLSLPDIPEEVLQQYPGVARAMEELSESGLRLYAKDASLGGRFPVVCIAAVNPFDGGVFAAFGSHPRFDIALERTFTEMLQGRDEIKGFPGPSFDEDLVTSPGNIEEHFVDSAGTLHWDFFKETPDHLFTPWGDGAPLSRAEEYDLLVSLIHEEGGEIYCWESDHLGLPCCRMIVPGLSEIYPVEELVWESRSRQVSLREGLLSLDTLSEFQAQTLFHLMEEGAFPPETPVCELVGVLTDGPWAGVLAAEVAAWFSFLAEETEDAARWFGVAARLEVPAERRLYHQAMEAWLTAHIEGEEPPNLSRVMPADVMRRVKASVGGTPIHPFPLRPFGELMTCGAHGLIADRVSRLRRVSVSG